MIASLLDTALEPILKEKNSETQILALKVCDPACGSGHFLLAAAHRIAKKLASIRTQEPEPPPDFLRSAIRDVIGHCIYGVDINPMSVELCKVSLWMEALEPGKPLSFLDHRILCGNSLIGVYPALMELGIPDDAFTPIEGDDKKICQKYKTLNRKERGTASPRSLFDAAGEKWFGSRDLSNHFMNLDDIDDSTINGYHRKAETYHNMLHSANYQNNKLIADVWCAAFVWKKIETEALLYPIHQEVFQQLRKNPTAIPGWMKQEINRLAEQYRFFHFHLAFPDVFRLSEEGEESMNLHTGWHGGFDVVLGNPPWERIKLQEKEWFASRCPDIANAANASNRQKMIENLAQNDPFVYNAFIEERRKAEGESHFIRNSTKFPLCGRGDVNTFSIFTETNREIISPVGRVGCIVPSGIATDDTTKFFFQDIVSTRTLVSLYDFENRNAIFPGVHRSYKFCLLTLTGRKRPNTRGAEFIFFALSTSELRDKERLFTLTADEIALVNPNTRTCPIFRYQRDAKLVKKIYQEVPILMAEEESVNPWQVKFLRMLDMANDSNLFRTKDELLAEGWELSGNVFKKDSESFYPLYEAKMFHHFNYRFGSFDDLPKNDISAQLPIISPERLKSPYFSNFPRYWIEKKEILSKFIKYPHLNKNCFLSLRKICRNNDERSVIASVLPFSGVSDSSNLFLFNEKLQYTFVLSANLSSFILDFVARLKMGGTNLNFFIFKQFPVLPPETYSIKTPWHTNIQLSDWIKPYVLELTYTAWDLEPFARDCGYDGPPFIWDEERRFLLRCELDAAYFHLYGIKADDVDYIMETFPIVKRKDEKAFGSFRTKDKILEIYRHMAAAIQNEKPYQTQLNPPPADEQVAHKNHKTIS